MILVTVGKGSERCYFENYYYIKLSLCSKGEFDKHMPVLMKHRLKVSFVLLRAMYI